MKALVAIKLKDEVSDAAGRTLQEKLVDLGFNEVREARIGKLLELDMNSADAEAVKKRVEEMGRKILADKDTEELHLVGLVQE